MFNKTVQENKKASPDVGILQKKVKEETLKLIFALLDVSMYVG